MKHEWYRGEGVRETSFCAKCASDANDPDAPKDCPGETQGWLDVAYTE